MAYENEIYLLPKQFDVEVTSCRFSTRYGALQSLFGDRQFLEVSSLKALSRLAIGRFCRFQGLWSFRGW